MQHSWISAVLNSYSEWLSAIETNSQSSTSIWWKVKARPPRNRRLHLLSAKQYRMSELLHSRYRSDCITFG